MNEAGLHQETLQAIARLLQEKRDGAELRTGPRVPVLNGFIESEFTRFDAGGLTRCVPEGDVRALSAVFRETPVEVWNWGLESAPRPFRD